MARPGPFEVRTASAALKDISSIWKWTVQHFREPAALRYEELIEQSILDLAHDPLRFGAKARPDLMSGLWVYHLHFSRENVPKEQSVKSPRHFVMFRHTEFDVIEILRVLHDSRDLNDICLSNNYRPERQC